MRNKAVSSACVGAGIIMALCAPSIGLAQGTPTGSSTNGGSINIAGEFGARYFAKPLDSLAIGKFQEYRDLRAGQKTSPVFQQLFLSFVPGDSIGTYSITGRNLFDRDQSVFLQAKRPGTYDFQINWDRILHTYSTDARSPGVENNPGFNTLPVPRPDSLAWRSAPYIAPIMAQWEPVKASLALTPSKEADFKVDYEHIGKRGGIPASVSFNGSSGPQREFVSPIDQTMHELMVSQSFTSDARTATSRFIKNWQLMGSYGYSRFENAITSVMVDNPQLSANSFANGAASSRISLAPNNSAQMGHLTASVLLPLRTRLSAVFSGSWAYQNDPFVPQTNNDSLARDPNYSLVGTLPRASLNGETRTLTMNLSATSHPFSKLSLAGKFRSYDYAPLTDPFRIRAMVVSDRTVTPSDSNAAVPLPYRKYNGDVSASYQLATALLLTAGVATENWRRDDQAGNGLFYDANAAVRDFVSNTDEATPRVSLDYNGLDWLSLRASYLQGMRRSPDLYVVSATEIAGFRRFDLADRDRKRTTLMASVNPVSSLSVELDYQVWNDTYPNSQYGTQSDKNTMGGIDVDWAPMKGLTASVGYTHEKDDNILDSRFRTGAVGSVTDNNPTYNWTSTTQDRNSTTYASLTATLIPDQLDFNGSVSVFDGSFLMLNVNPVAPAGGTATNILNATAENWPLVSSRLAPISLALRYHYNADWAMTVRYQYEKYDQNDFRTSAPLFTSNGLASGTPITSFTGGLPGTIGQIAGTNTGQYHFLSAAYLPYNAAWLTVTISYHPSLMMFEKGRSTM